MNDISKDLVLSPAGALYFDAQLKLCDLLEEEKRIKELKDKATAVLLSEMEKHGVVKIDTDMLTVTYIPETDRERFDSKKLREECPEVYDAYATMSPVKSSVRIKVKQ